MFSEGGEALRSRTKKDRHIAKNCTMSTDTKEFIQKFCYRQTASIDMTNYGFIADSKINPVNLVIKPLKEQLEKIRVKPQQHGRLPSTSRLNVPEVGSLPKLKPSCTLLSEKPHRSLHIPPRVVVNPDLLSGPAERRQSATPKSALSNPGTRPTRAVVRKVRIQSDRSPSPVTARPKQVSLLSPRRNRGKGK